MRLLVQQVVQRTADIRSFVLVHPLGADLPVFTAGAHLSIGVRLPDGRTATRSYSLVNHPDERTHYEIAVLHQPQGQGGSGWMHGAVGIGDMLDVEGPRNAFPLSDSASHHVLIAGGIGITPILCMARVLARRRDSAEVHYFGRAPDALAYLDILQALPGIETHAFISAERDSVVAELQSRIGAARNGRHLYVCGPAGMIQRSLDIAAAQGWAEDHVHHERFAAAAPPTGNDPFVVQLVQRGLRFEVAAGQTLLDALIAQGVDAASDCRTGVCGTCLVRVAGGEIDHRDSFLSADDRADGSLMCVCVSRGKGLLQLDL